MDPASPRSEPSSPRRPRSSKGSVSPGRPHTATRALFDRLALEGVQGSSSRSEFSPRIEISITSEIEVEAPANYHPDADAPIKTDSKATSPPPLTSVAVEAGADKVRTEAAFVGVRVRASPSWA